MVENEKKKIIPHNCRHFNDGVYGEAPTYRYVAKVFSLKVSNYYVYELLRLHYIFFFLEIM